MACNFKPYEGKEGYIFVSYAHVDGEMVYPILERMNEAGYRIWYDEGIEWGTEWSDSIASHIDNCEVCLAFHSKASSISKHCRREINYAIDIDKGILSIYLEEVEFNSGMKMQLSSYQSTFWHQYENKEQFFDRLINNTSILEPCKGSNEEVKEKYIFVSYARRDSDIVYPILERLKKEGIKVWYDEDIEWATGFSDSIKGNINGCEEVIAFLSNSSSESEYFKREINYAINKNKRIIPIFLEPEWCVIGSEVEMLLAPYQSILWYRYEDEDKEKFIYKLIGAIR